MPASAAIPRRPAAAARATVLWPDRRPVGAALLPGLRHLDEHAARPVAAQRGAAPQQLVGAFDRLDPEHEPLLHDDGLADIERAERAGDAHPVLDIGFGVVVRPMAAEQAPPASNRRLPAMSSAPITRNPSRSNSLTTADSSPSSPSAR